MSSDLCRRQSQCTIMVGVYVAHFKDATTLCRRPLFKIFIKPQKWVLITTTRLAPHALNTLTQFDLCTNFAVATEENGTSCSP